jgi:protein-L-isoaspartate(D-aspartate) O-methyltransferase
MYHEWYYSFGGVQHGPLPEAELSRRIQASELPPDVSVCRAGTLEWRAAREHTCFQPTAFPQPGQAVNPPRLAPPPVIAADPKLAPEPLLEKKSSALPWILAGSTVVILFLVAVPVLYFTFFKSKSESGGETFDPSFPMDAGKSPAGNPNPPPRKTDWRDLHEQRFGNTPILAAELKTKREAMVRRIKASEDGDFIDKKVLDAMADIPMELFCPADQLPNVYANLPVPIGYEETISQPTLTAMMLTLLKVNRGDRVLELKTASGYQTALLAHMGAKVYSLETDRSLGRVMSPTLNGLGFADLHYEVGGDTYAGLPAQGPYDRIIATAAYPSTPWALFRQLKPGGRLIAPVGDVDTGQQLMLYQKTPGGEIKELKLLPVAFGMMPR